MLAPWKKNYDQTRQHIKNQRHYLADEGPYSQSYGFSSSHAWIWELDHKKDWVPKNWWFLTAVLEKTFESPLDCKEIKSVNPKGNQPWIFTGRTDAETEAPILWLPDAKSWLTGKDPDAGKDGRQEKGTIEDEMVGIASPTQWTWVWASTGRWWRTEKLAVLQSMGSQRVRSTKWLNNPKSALFSAWRLLTEQKEMKQRFHWGKQTETGVLDGKAARVRGTE